MNPWAIAIGAALGALKNNVDEKNAHAQRGVESTKSRWATFTGQHGQNVANPNLMGNVMQGAMTGAMMGQAMGGGEAAAGAGEAAAGAGEAAGATATPATPANMTPASNMYASNNAFNNSMAQQYPWLR